MTKGRLKREDNKETRERERDWETLSESEKIDKDKGSFKEEKQ